MERERERARVSFERRKLQFHGGGARIVLEIDASPFPLPPSFLGTVLNDANDAHVKKMSLFAVDLEGRGQDFR